jgi:hypothetical protein
MITKMKYRNKLIEIAMLQSSLLLLFIVALAFANCGSSKSAAGGDKSINTYNTRQLLLRDEGKSQLSYINLANPDKNWYVPVPPGRDIQLAGNGRVLIGTGNGYEEIEIATGKKIVELITFPGTVAARRLRNGNTLLTGVNWQNKKGIVLVEVNSSGAVQRTINYTGFDYVRLVRETPAGNFLITSNNVVFEGNDSGAIVWQAKIISAVDAHSWQALRLPNGQTIVSGGFAKNFQLFSADGKITDSISGLAEVKPNFYAGFQILSNGHYVVCNWQGHGPTNGAKGTQLFEYDPAGKLVWKWQQDADKFSSIQGVIVLDGLDLNLLHVEDINGKLAPVMPDGLKK